MHTSPTAAAAAATVEEFWVFRTLNGGDGERMWEVKKKQRSRRIAVFINALMFPLQTEAIPASLLQKWYAELPPQQVCSFLWILPVYKGRPIRSTALRMREDGLLGRWTEASSLIVYPGQIDIRAHCSGPRTAQRTAA
ncbi:hypothetical protein HPP92_005869 [Vanilla planifolia]|uniref:Uncharacterized protein n=1 Tax=Vanilla planifolia TaxID=51239 RepID=A0A835VFA3_VANPL|nr:hypothetical protein HPP92_005869 [Vanilla planifolia]